MSTLSAATCKGELRLRSLTPSLWPGHATEERACLVSMKSAEGIGHAIGGKRWLFRSHLFSRIWREQLPQGLGLVSQHQASSLCGCQCFFLPHGDCHVGMSYSQWIVGVGPH